MASEECIVGIDLGTTFSEVAAFIDNRVQVISRGVSKMLPSCVGISPAGELLLGEPARRQHLVYPERTVRSIKRKMGSNEKVDLAGKLFSPQEISALILKELADWASERMGYPIRRAVITVPAYFSDAQRNATREAGALAGLEVIRILNEPTAASLAYGYGEGGRRTVMIYDLGGGTFDVSIVSMEGDVTEVLASHGNNHLGGDDFDELVAARFLERVRQEHGVDLKAGHRAACARLLWAAEDAKKKLSFEPYVTVREDNLAVVDGRPVHLEMELAQEEYENMIRPLIETTLDSVSKALKDAGKKPADLDAILLVGGSTRTPLVSRVLEERAGLTPRQEIHPDLCVALGAGVLASRLSGHEVDRVLLDVSPYSFGPSYLGERDGEPYPHCYLPIIRANTPLPITRTEKYWTAYEYQTIVEVNVYQGDDPDALKNIPVGTFHVEGLTPIQEPNEVLCRMKLDLDGILQVTAIEKMTGRSKQITISNALEPKSESELAAARNRLQDLFSSRAASADDRSPKENGGEEQKEEVETPADVVSFGRGVEAEEDAARSEEGTAGGDAPPKPDEAWLEIERQASKLVERSRALLPNMHDDDKEEAIGLHENIETAIRNGDFKALAEAAEKLKELLFFIEGR